MIEESKDDLLVFDKEELDKIMSKYEDEDN